MTHHPGNIMFENIIESRLKDHMNTNQDGKHLIEFDIIRYVRCVKRGRFLKWDIDKGWWSNMVVDDNYGDDDPIDNRQEGGSIAPNAAAYAATLNKKQLQEIRLKVHYAFRDFVKKQKTQQNLQVLRSSTYLFERQQHEMHYSKRTPRGSIGAGGGISSDDSNCTNTGCSTWLLCDADSDDGTLLA